MKGRGAMRLLECAAQALALSKGDDWEGLSLGERTHYEDGARAVLEALRDPDTRMTEAGAEIIRNVGPAESEAAHRSDAANTWRFMIDALLGGSQPEPVEHDPSAAAG